MGRRLVLLFFTVLSNTYACFAQDPGVSGLFVTYAVAIPRGGGMINVNLINGSSAPIPQANNATWVINLPPNVGVPDGLMGITISPDATNITTTITPYSSTTGTTITFVSNLGPVPGNASYAVVVKLIGVQPSLNVPISISVSSNPPLATNDTSNDTANMTIIVTGIMPVNLVAFTARAQENHTVTVNWTTSLETDNKGFLVERSKNMKHFEKVGEMNEVALMSNALKSYHLTDPTPYSGTSYYRLTQTDLSGKETVYPAVSVVLREEAYGVFPNPVVSDGRFTLRLDEPETAIVGFYSADGQLLPLQKTGVESGTLLLKTTSLSAGVYILRVDERGQTRQHRLVIE